MNLSKPIQTGEEKSNLIFLTPLIIYIYTNCCFGFVFVFFLMKLLSTTKKKKKSRSINLSKRGPFKPVKRIQTSLFLTPLIKYIYTPLIFYIPNFSLLNERVIELSFTNRLDLSICYDYPNHPYSVAFLIPNLPFNDQLLIINLMRKRLPLSFLIGRNFCFLQ